MKTNRTTKKAETSNKIQRYHINMGGFEVNLFFGHVKDIEKADYCETMDRPKSKCGCPDCGSSLVGYSE